MDHPAALIATVGRRPWKGVNLPVPGAGTGMNDSGTERRGWLRNWPSDASAGADQWVTSERGRRVARRKAAPHLGAVAHPTVVTAEPIRGGPLGPRI